MQQVGEGAMVIKDEYLTNNITDREDDDQWWIIDLLSESSYINPVVYRVIWSGYNFYLAMNYTLFIDQDLHDQTVKDLETISQRVHRSAEGDPKEFHCPLIPVECYIIYDKSSGVIDNYQIIITDIPCSFLTNYMDRYNEYKNYNGVINEGIWKLATPRERKQQTAFSGQFIYKRKNSAYQWKGLSSKTDLISMKRIAIPISINDSTILHLTFEDLEFARDLTYKIWTCKFKNDDNIMIIPNIPEHEAQIKVISTFVYLDHNSNPTFHCCIYNVSQELEYQPFDYLLRFVHVRSIPGDDLSRTVIEDYKLPNIIETKKKLKDEILNTSLNLMTINEEEEEGEDRALALWEARKPQQRLQPITRSRSQQLQEVTQLREQQQQLLLQPPTRARSEQLEQLQLQLSQSAKLKVSPSRPASFMVEDDENEVKEDRLNPMIKRIRYQYNEYLPIITKLDGRINDYNLTESLFINEQKLQEFFLKLEQENVILVGFYNEENTNEVLIIIDDINWWRNYLNHNIKLQQYMNFFQFLPATITENDRTTLFIKFCWRIHIEWGNSLYIQEPIHFFVELFQRYVVSTGNDYFKNPQEDYDISKWKILCTGYQHNKTDLIIIIPSSLWTYDTLNAEITRKFSDQWKQFLLEEIDRNVAKGETDNSNELIQHMLNHSTESIAYPGSGFQIPFPFTYIIDEPEQYRPWNYDTDKTLFVELEDESFLCEYSNFDIPLLKLLDVDSVNPLNYSKQLKDYYILTLIEPVKPLGRFTFPPVRRPSSLITTTTTTTEKRRRGRPTKAEAAQRLSLITTTTPTEKRRRGRPTKAEAAERLKLRQQEEGEQPITPKTPRTKRIYELTRSPTAKKKKKNRTTIQQQEEEEEEETGDDDSLELQMLVVALI
jgi:hypothetical protein